MFLKYIDFIFAPFRAIQSKIFGVRSIKGAFAGDINRSKAFAAARSKRRERCERTRSQARGPGQQGAQAMAGQGMPGMPGMPQMPGARSPWLTFTDGESLVP